MSLSLLDYDVVVIGGGHAGIEAAAASARMGAVVALITMDPSKLGAMHCNPSIGGLGKGHLVYEVSALGGVMPKLCTKTYLQAKMLNTSKGPAVQGLRLQIDKIAYQREAFKIISSYPNLTMIQDEVIDVLTEQSNDGLKIIVGLILNQYGKISCKAIVISTGTFLNSAVYVGKERFKTISSLNISSSRLSESLEKVIDKKLSRLKTGTPPRILKESIDFSKLEYQPSHKLDYLFEFDPCDVKETAACFITHTTASTHKIIAENLKQAGYDPTLKKGMEPRYCPSIETKVFRFPEKQSHHVFIEPESLELNEIYPAGLSNSLPFEIQQQFVRTVIGLENAILTQPGFMIEYDFLQPNNLSHALEHKQVKGLFFAGQVNGTTGYEEAAAQGIMAGINAALLVQEKAPFILSRHESYIGIMIDDLVSLGVDEPYRMFTSRAERRLILRQDNVFERLYPYAIELGLISRADFAKHQEELSAIELIFEHVKKYWGRSEIFNIFNAVHLEEEGRARAVFLLTNVFESKGLGIDLITSRVLTTVHAKVKYDGYLAREMMEVAKAKNYSDEQIPECLMDEIVPGLSTELQEKLKRYKPQTIAQAQLIPGMTPAAISLIIFRCRLLKI